MLASVISLIESNLGLDTGLLVYLKTVVERQKPLLVEHLSVGYLRNYWDSYKAFCRV